MILQTIVFKLCLKTHHTFQRDHCVGTLGVRTPMPTAKKTQHHRAKKRFNHGQQRNVTSFRKCANQEQHISFVKLAIIAMQR